MNGKTVILKTIENKVFPAYAAQVVDPHTVVIGGGGSGNTGTFNGLVFLRIEHDGNSSYSVLDGTFSTMEPADTMAMHEQDNEKFIAVGLSKECMICKISRRKKQDSLANGIEDISPIEYSAVTISSEVVCASSCVTRVRISPDGTFLAVGCENGSIKIYSFPGMVLIREILAHKELISDLDITEDGQKICSVARNGSGTMWQVKDGKRLNDLELPKCAKYTFKRVKFSRASSNNKIWLYAIANPVVKSTNSSVLYKFNTANFSIKDKALFSKDILSALATSSDSSYIAVGNMNGDVMVHDAKTLMRVYLFKADRFGAITDLEFLRLPIPFQTIDGSMTLALVSTSLNGFTRLHSLTEDTRPNIWFLILLILLGVLLVYILKIFEVDVIISEFIQSLIGPDGVKTEL
ncbi:uncharacterized protein LOC136036420 isoform X2 [Artemia franciscana]|uniref:uncharacterized protein LOC136036420 isoform X2 n=1 Tax=Artemia franciscana TaxID=6661 RepID=UPI0032DB2CAD